MGAPADGKTCSRPLDSGEHDERCDSTSSWGGSRVGSRDAEVDLGAAPRAWLLLSYKVPRAPTAKRVYVWRKLKKLGAVSLQDSVWVLPATAHAREQFRWLASEIDEMGGETTLWESTLLSDGQEERLVGRFAAAVEEVYGEILAALRRKNADLAALGRRYQQAWAQDYFHSELGRRVRRALLAAKGDHRP